MQTARHTRAGFATSAMITRTCSGMNPARSETAAGALMPGAAVMPLSLLTLPALALTRPATEHADGVAGLDEAASPQGWETR